MPDPDMESGPPRAQGFSLFTASRPARRTATQFVRYATVGAASNAILYVAYLLLTTLGIDPKAAMTILYAVGIVQTFAFNKRWTFSHQTDARLPFVRYGALYLVGYGINYAALLFLVDGAGLAHQAVQAVMIVSLAFFFFSMQKYWVFRSSI